MVPSALFQLPHDRFNIFLERSIPSQGVFAVERALPFTDPTDSLAEARMKRKIFATAVVLVVMATPLFAGQAASSTAKPSASAQGTKQQGTKQTDEQRRAAVLKETAALRAAAEAAARKQAAAAKAGQKPSTTAAAKPAAGAPKPAPTNRSRC